MVLSPRPDDVREGGLVTGAWIARFEARSLADIRAVGRNSPADDRAFAAVARLSELNLSIYQTFAQPFVRALANQPAADLAQASNPLRLSYTIFADGNPWMSGVRELSAGVAAARSPAAADNPFTKLQTMASDQITASLEAYRVARDQCTENMFFGLFGSKFVQALLGLNANDEVRSFPNVSPEELAVQKSRADNYLAKLDTGGFDEALIRAVLYVMAADRTLDQRCALALNHARQHLMHLSLGEFKILVREQFFVLPLERERAVNAIAYLAQEADSRAELLKQTRSIIDAGDPPSAAARERLARLSELLATPIERPVAASAIADQ